jgi:2-keto-3-deoxy-galactonokinase
MVIGHELRAQETRSFRLLGAPELTSLYQQAAQLLGMQTELLDPDAAVRALARLGAMLR